MRPFAGRDPRWVEVENSADLWRQGLVDILEIAFQMPRRVAYRSYHLWTGSEDDFVRIQEEVWRRKIFRLLIDHICFDLQDTGLVRLDGHDVPVHRCFIKVGLLPELNFRVRAVLRLFYLEIICLSKSKLVGDEVTWERFDQDV